MRKEKSMKHILLSLMLLFTLVFSIGKVSAEVITNYYGIEMTEAEYSTLEELGFTTNEIYYMNQETFEENRYLDATLLGSTTKYYKTVYPTYGNSYTVEVSEEEYNNHTNNHEPELRTTVVTNYKTMVSTISQNGSKYRFHVSVLWTNMPSTRSYDIIAIGYSNSNMYISSSVYFNYVYARSDGSYTTSTLYYNKKSLSTGGSAAYKVPDGDLSALSANLYYDVSKNTSNTITSIQSCGDYSHAITNIDVSNIANYNVGINGIALSTGLYGNYDAIPCALTTIGVSW